MIEDEHTQPPLYPVIAVPELDIFLVGSIDCNQLISPICPCDNTACNVRKHSLLGETI